MSDTTTTMRQSSQPYCNDYKMSIGHILNPIIISSPVVGPATLPENADVDDLTSGDDASEDYELRARMSIDREEYIASFNEGEYQTIEGAISLENVHPADHYQDFNQGDHPQNLNEGGEPIVLSEIVATTEHAHESGSDSEVEMTDFNAWLEANSRSNAVVPYVKYNEVDNTVEEVDTAAVDLNGGNLADCSNKAQPTARPIPWNSGADDFEAIMKKFREGFEEKFREDFEATTKQLRERFLDSPQAQVENSFSSNEMANPGAPPTCSVEHVVLIKSEDSSNSADSDYGDSSSPLPCPKCKGAVISSTDESRESDISDGPDEELVHQHFPSMDADHGNSPRAYSLDCLPQDSCDMMDTDHGDAPLPYSVDSQPEDSSDSADSGHGDSPSPLPCPKCKGAVIPSTDESKESDISDGLDEDPVYQHLLSMAEQGDSPPPFDSLPPHSSDSMDTDHDNSPRPYSLDSLPQDRSDSMDTDHRDSPYPHDVDSFRTSQARSNCTDSDNGDSASPLLCSKCKNPVVSSPDGFDEPNESGVSDGPDEELVYQYLPNYGTNHHLENTAVYGLLVPRKSLKERSTTRPKRSAKPDPYSLDLAGSSQGYDPDVSRARSPFRSLPQPIPGSGSVEFHTDGSFVCDEKMLRHPVVVQLLKLGLKLASNGLDFDRLDSIQTLTNKIAAAEAGSLSPVLPFSCPAINTCRKTFETVIEAKRHEIREHYPVVNCPYCTHGFRLQSNMATHLSLAHPHVNAQDDELVHEAMKRMYHADLDSIPDEHMWIFKALGIISPDSKIPEARASKQSPPIQNIFAVQTTPVSQTKHVVKSEPQTHELAKPWVCDFCPKAYYKQWSRDIHMKTHQKGHLCPFCPTEGPSKEYTDFTILQCHIGNKHSNVFRRDPRIIALITKMREGLESRFGRYQKDGLGDWFWKGNQEEGAGAELGKQVEQQTEKNSDFNQGQKRKRVDEDVGANHDKHVVKQEETEKDADVQHVKKQKTVDEGVGTDSVEQGEQQTETDADVTLAKKIKTENEW